MILPSYQVLDQDLVLQLELLFLLHQLLHPLRQIVQLPLTVQLLGLQQGIMVPVEPSQ